MRAWWFVSYPPQPAAALARCDAQLSPTPAGDHWQRYHVHAACSLGSAAGQVGRSVSRLSLSHSDTSQHFQKRDRTAACAAVGVELWLEPAVATTTPFCTSVPVLSSTGR